MILVGLVDAQKLHFTARVGRIGIAGDLEAREDRITVFIGVVDEEPSILGILRMKSQPQQSLFISAASNSIGDVEEGLG